MRRVVVAVITLAVLAGLGGCMKSPDTEAEGIIHITIQPTNVQPQSITPKLIPANAEKVRIRIWHPSSGFNGVSTIALQPQGQTVDIAVPSNNGYFVDAVSYYNVTLPLALTGGRAGGVNVAVNATTNVQITLRAWHVDVIGSDNVAPEAEYALDFVATDGGGLITRQTFDTATLRASTTSFQDPTAPLPPFPGTVGVAYDDRIPLTGTAPDVDVETTLYMAALVQFNQYWYDYALPNQAERPMFLELPNRHMEDTLHEITVAPVSGGIVVDISSE